MTTLTNILPAHSLDEDRLRAYLAERIPGFDRMTVLQFQGGQSNPTFLLEGSAGKFVLRKKPPGVLLPSAHQIEREFRVISALHGSVIPVPRPILLCEDVSIIGTPFYVMEYVAGRILERPDLDTLAVSERRAAYDALNATIADLHGIDWVKAGLTGFGRPENYLARQVDRWSRQYKASLVGASDPLVEEVIAWLNANMPATSAVVIAHGDFRLGNLIFAPETPRVAAVLDWELSTLGDPISDFAYCCTSYRLPAGVAGVRGLRGLDLPSRGIPTEDEFVAAYCRRTGRDATAHWPFYMAFSLFRLTAIVQGVYARAVRGNASNADALSVGGRLATLAGAAHEVAYGPRG